MDREIQEMGGSVEAKHVYYPEVTVIEVSEEQRTHTACYCSEDRTYT